MIPSTIQNYVQVAVVSFDNNNLYSQRLTQAERDKVQKEEVDLASLSSSNNIIDLASSQARVPAQLILENANGFSVRVVGFKHKIYR